MILFSFIFSVMSEFFFHIFEKKNCPFFPQKVANLVIFTLEKPKKSQIFVEKKFVRKRNSNHDSLE
jgi:hypothetical protein